MLKDNNIQLYIGLLSGTSIDSIDTAIIAINSASLNIVATYSHCIPSELKNDLNKIICEQTVSLVFLGELNRRLGIVFAEAVNAILDNNNLTCEQITAIGFHGQTIFHQPVLPYNFSMQIGDPNTLTEYTKIPVITDFRQRDMVNNGQGAPLAPLFHQNYFSSPDITRAIVNIGGIVNITILPCTNNTNSSYASDLGPGNTLLDQWYLKHHKNSQYSYDNDGLWAHSGQVNHELLHIMLEDEYFSRKWPKSTGREYFNLNWLHHCTNKLHNLKATININSQDIQRTLLELSAVIITNNITNYNNSEYTKNNKISEVYICGGGAHNQTLFKRIASLLPSISVQTTQVLGMSPDWVEAGLFAWLAYNTWHKQKLNLQYITGNSNKETLLGCVYY